MLHAAAGLAPTPARCGTRARDNVTAPAMCNIAGACEVDYGRGERGGCVVGVHAVARDFPKRRGVVSHAQRDGAAHAALGIGPLRP